MIDLSFIGKEGLVIEYEDIISLIGMNTINYLIEKDVEKTIDVRMSSFEDILNSYINRSDKNISIWLSEHFNIDFDLSKFGDSFAVYKPNLFYAYKLIPHAFMNGIKNLYIHSQYESNAVYQNIITSFDVPIQYVHGDIYDILKDKVNYTYITANPDNVRRCLDIDTPLAITICDDYMSMSPIVQEHVDEELRKRGKFVSYTSVLSTGGIPK